MLSGTKPDLEMPAWIPMAPARRGSPRHARPGLARSVRWPSLLPRMPALRPGGHQEGSRSAPESDPEPPALPPSSLSGPLPAAAKTQTGRVVPLAKAALGGGPGEAFLFSFFFFAIVLSIDINWCIQSSNRLLPLGPGAVTARVPPALEPRAPGASPGPGLVGGGHSTGLRPLPLAANSGFRPRREADGGVRRPRCGDGDWRTPSPGERSWAGEAAGEVQAESAASLLLSAGAASAHIGSARRGGDRPARLSPRSRRLLSPAAPRASQSRAVGAPFVCPGAWVGRCCGAREHPVSFVGRRPQPGEGLGADPAGGPERVGLTPGSRTGTSPGAHISPSVSHFQAPASPWPSIQNIIDHNSCPMGLALLKTLLKIVVP